MTPRSITIRRTTLALWAGVLVALVPITLVVAYVAAQGNLAPVGDQWWDVGYVAIKLRAGILTPEDLFLYFSGHRPVVIRLLTVLFTLLTDYNVQIMRFMAVAVALLSLLAASLLVAHRHKRLLPLAVPLFALVLFTLYHEDSWLDYYFSVWNLTLLFPLLGLLVLQRMKPGWRGFLLIIVCALGASFSMGLGIAAWFSLPVAWLAQRPYRRWQYLLAWGIAFALFFAFYRSGYAVSPYETDGGSFSPQALLRDGVGLTAVYLLQFQSTRFDGETVNLFALALGVLAILLIIVNSVFWLRREREPETPALWLSLVLFAVGGAGLTIVGRGVYFPVPARYSPGADGFWLALVALGLLALMRRPRPVLAAANGVVLALVVLFTVQKDVWLLQRNADPYPPECDQCVLDTPLKRDGCFRACFYWGDEQSVYQFAALRLSVFRDVPPRLLLPESASPVVTDVPHRWLGVYVRDTLLAGVPAANIATIAPEQGAWALPNEPYSPFYRGEWSTDMLPQPLENIWNTPEAFAAHLPARFAGQPRVWLINTPETEAHFAALDAAFAEAGYTGTRWTLNDPQDATARFGVWCYGVGAACALEN